jgi:ATP-dependent Lhr-like helicase
MLAITREEAMRGLVDFSRIEAMIERIGARIDIQHLDRPSPLAAPLFLEPGKIPVDGAGRDRLAADAAAQLMRDAGLA